MKYLLILATIWSVSLSASVSEYQDTLKAAKQNSAVAQNELGDMYRDGNYLDVDQNYSRAIRWYRRAAKQDYAPAQLSLGLMYSAGFGVKQSDVEAFKWLRKAGEQGIPVAQHVLGIMYDNGEGVASNAAEAAKWYRKAAEQGFAASQFKLGNAYANGKGVGKNAPMALKWYRVAASQGHVEASNIVRQHDLQEKQKRQREVQLEKQVDIKEKLKRQQKEEANKSMTIPALSLLGVFVVLFMAIRSKKETPQQKIWRQDEEQRQLKELELQRKEQKELKQKEQEQLLERQRKEQKELKQREKEYLLERQRKEQKELKQKRQKKEAEEELERQRKEQEELKRQQKEQEELKRQQEERRLKDTLSLMQRSLPFYRSVTEEEGSESHAGKLRWKGVLQAVTLNDDSVATLYFVKLLSLLDNREYYKIGMTAKSVEERFETSTQIELLEVVATFTAARYLVLFAEYHFIREFEITDELSKLPDMSGPDVKFSGSSEVVRANARGKISGFFEKLKGYEDKVRKGVIELI